MKNFFKKLSFVLAIAMVLTSIAPATASAKEVVPAKKVNVKLDGEKVTSVELDVEETKTVKVGLVVKKAYAGQKSTYKTWYSVADETVVDVVKEGNRTYTLTGVAAGETTITIRAAKTLKLAKAGKGVKAELNVVVNEKAAELTAKQTATNKITVNGTNLSANAADYSLKFGTASKTLKAVTVNDAKTEAVIEVGSSNMVEGVYTLTFGEASVELKCEPSKVTSIVLKPENAIYVTSTSAVAYYTVFNQFEEDVTRKAFGDLSISGSDGVANSATPGKLEFTNTTNGYNLNLSQVSVSIVDKATATVISKVLLVTEESKLKEATIAGLYKIQGGSYVPVDSIPEGTTDLQIANYKLLVTGVDQYGLEFPVEKLDNKSLNITLSSATGLFAKVAAPNSVTYTEINDVKYAVVDLEVNNTDKALVAGEVSILGVVLTSGIQLNGTINVAEITKIDSISISAPNGVYGGQDNVLAYTILDTDGNEITDIDTLCLLNNVDYMKEFGKIKFVGSADGTAKLVYTADTTDNNTVETISWITPTLNYGYTQLNIKPDRKPVAVVGVWSPAETGYNATIGVELAATANNRAGNITVGLEDFKYEDQYGNLFAWYEYGFVAGKIAVTTSVDTDMLPHYIATKEVGLNKGFAATTAATGIVTSSTIKVEVETSIKLPTATKDTVNEYAFTVAFAALNDVTGIYGYTLADLYYASEADTPVWHGLGGFYAGKGLSLVGGYDYVTVDSTASAIYALKDGYNVTQDDSVTSVVKNAVGTVVKTDIKKSNIDGYVKSANAYAGGYPFAGGYATVTAGATVISQLGKVRFGQVVKAADQYGNTTAGAAHVPADLNSARVTFSNLPADYTKYTLTDNGTANVALTFNAAGWYTVKATFEWADGKTYDATLVFEVKPAAK